MEVKKFSSRIFVVYKKGENKTNKMKLCTIKKQIDANTITEWVKIFFCRRFCSCCLMLRCGTTLLYSKFNFASKVCKIFSLFSSTYDVDAVYTNIVYQIIFANSFNVSNNYINFLTLARLRNARKMYTDCHVSSKLFF